MTGFNHRVKDVRGICFALPNFVLPGKSLNTLDKFFDPHEKTFDPLLLNADGYGNRLNNRLIN